MDNLEVGKVYINGKLTREIVKIDGYQIYYKTEKGVDKNCWITSFQDWVRKGKKLKCEYCNDNTEENLRGDDGIVYDGIVGKYYLYAEHFRGEQVRIEVDYCPKCGRKLEK
jgi:hypothetical protein